MIGYYAHHHGAGHITRMRNISAALAEPVWGLSSAPKPPHWRGGWTQLAPDDISDGEGSFDPEPTAHGVLHWAPLHHKGLMQRTAQVAAWAAENQPRALVVDVSVEISLLARLCGVPTIVIAMPGQRMDRAHRLAYDSADALLAPWPRGAHNLHWPHAWSAKTWFVGAFSRFDHLTPSAARDFLEKPQHTVLVLWGAGGRNTPPEEVRAAAAATPEWTWTERSPGTFTDEDVWDDLQTAAVVVTHAGQNSVAEVAAARCPAVVVAQARPYGEQIATARRLEEWHIAVGCDAWPPAWKWPGLLARAQSHGGHGWARWSSGNGAEQVAIHMHAFLNHDQP